MGLLRYAVLLSVGGDDYCIIDIKQAVRAVAPRYQHVSMPRDNAGRVVEGAHQMSPALGERMIAERFLDHGVFIRELLPQDLKLELNQMSIEEAIRMSQLSSVRCYLHMPGKWMMEPVKAGAVNCNLTEASHYDTPALVMEKCSATDV